MKYSLRKKNIFIIYTLVVLSLITYYNITNNYTPSSSPYSVPPKPFLTPSQQNESYPPTSLFRGNAQRTGVYKFDHPIESLRGSQIFSPINVSPYDASKSSPAIDESGIYVGSDSGWFYGLEHNGTIRWKYKVDRANHGIHSTAVLDKKWVYFGAYNGHFYALDKYSGAPKWIVKLGDNIGASANMTEDNIFISVELSSSKRDGFIVNMLKSTGEVVWKTKNLGEQSHSSPTVNIKNNELYVGANNGKIFSFNILNGQKKWEFTSQGPIKGTPLYYEKSVYFTNWGGDLTALNSDTGKLKWKYNLGDKSQSSPSLIEDQSSLVVSSRNGFLYALDLQSGQKIWKTNIKTNYGSLTSPTVTKNQNGKTYIWSLCGNYNYCVFSSSNGEMLKSFLIPSQLSGQAVPFKDAIYLSLISSGGVFKLSKENQKETLKTKVLLDIPNIRQERKLCAPASLEMLLKYMGYFQIQQKKIALEILDINKNSRRIRESYQKKIKDLKNYPGTSLNMIQNYLRENTRPFYNKLIFNYLNRRSLKSENKNMLIQKEFRRLKLQLSKLKPVIVHQYLNFKDNKTGHYLLVVGFDEILKNVYINNPEKDKLEVQSYSDFLKLWNYDGPKAPFFSLTYKSK